MIDRGLLWRAWPGGYLEMRGVRTVSGWQCVDGTWGLPLWVDPGVPFRMFGLTHGLWPGIRLVVEPEVVIELIKRGDLLPNVDPADQATWACLLSDLAGPDAQNVTWRRSNMGPTTGLGKPSLVWCLSHQDPKTLRGRLVQRFDIDTDDPALALVTARIHLREESP